MAQFLECSYENQKVQMDGGSFEKCKFKNCELIYSGGEIPSLVSCTFEDCDFGFSGAASNTLQFLHAMNHGGFKSIIHKTIVGLSSPEPMRVKAV